VSLNSAIVHILRYFTELDNFARQLRHSGWKWTV